LAAQVRAQAAHPWFSDGQAALARVNVLQLSLLLETPLTRPPPAPTRMPCWRRSRAGAAG
jgi:hypothetical protein